MITALLAWAMALVAGWFWWGYLTTGVARGPGGSKHSRKYEPLNYWFSIVTLGLGIVIVFVCGIALALGL